MSSKSEKIQELMGEVPVTWPMPDLEPGEKLLDVGLYCVLLRDLTPPQALKTLRALRAAYPDWNELRVSQAQEFRPHVSTKSDDTGAQVARNVKAYLQEVFQNNHGFDLEFLREDRVEAARFVSELTFLGAGAAHYVLWYASGGVAATPGIVRVLDRLGLMKRTSSMRKAEEALAGQVPEPERAAFARIFGTVVERWCDAKKPICWECALVAKCPHGGKVKREWEALQVRLEAQRKKNAERRRKEAERERKRAEAEAKRRAVAEARKAAQEERKRVREEARKRAAAEKAAREAVRKKAAAKKKAAADKKKAAAKKKAAKKKAAKKKAAAKKKTSSRKKTAKKVARAGSRKKTATKRKTSKKSTTRPRTKAGAKKAGKRAKTASKRRTAKKKTRRR